MFVVKAKPDFAAKRVEYLYAARKQKKYCDSIFSVRDRNFYVHVVVLSACSEFFGINEGLVNDIFSKFDFEVVEAILEYCYTGEISIDDHHYEKLMELANLLEVKIPRQYKSVDLSNCPEVLTESNDSEFMKKAADLISENFGTLHKTQNFLKLPASTVIEILKWDNLNVPSEEDVFNSVKLWVNHDDANRRNELAQLMKSVRLSLLSLQFLVNDVMIFCHSCVDCMISLRQEILDNNNKSSNQRETRRRSKGKNTPTIPIVKIKVKIALVGGFDFGITNTIDIYDGETINWIQSRQIVNGKCRFSSVIVGDWIVIIGGVNTSWTSLNSVEYIDLKNGQKHALKPLNQARHNLSTVTLRRDSSTDVYAIGGFGPIDTVERWNSKTLDWEYVAPLLLAVHFHSASAIDEKIYVTGGRRNETSLDLVQMYSVETNSWTNSSHMIQARYNHSSVAFRGKLFVFGGYVEQTNTYLDSVEQFDPIANLWTEFTKLPKPAFAISPCYIQDRLLCLGGHDGNSDLGDVWEYDETRKTWNALKSLTKSRYRCIAHVVPYDSII